MYIDYCAFFQYNHERYIRTYEKEVFMQGTHDDAASPFLTCNHPIMDLSEVLGVVPLTVMNVTGGNRRLKFIEIVYGADGQPVQSQLYTEDVPSSNNSMPTAKTATTQTTKRSRTKRSGKSAADPSPRKRDAGRTRVSRNGDLKRFIASLPAPRERPDLKGTRWSDVLISSWLPEAISSGSRQTRSKALHPLDRANVHTVGQLRNMRVSELLALPGMGEGGVTYLARELAFYGLHFKPEPKIKPTSSD